MIFKSYLNILTLLLSFFVYSQDQLLLSFTIPDNLKQNANAVVRLGEIDISLKSPAEMVVKERRIITVLNKQGNSIVDAYVNYDSNVKIKTLEVLVYDAFGNNIKKIKKNDFKDISAVDGGTLYSDSRVKYLEYTPISYPYTIEFISETETSNTAFINPFYPVDDYFLSVQNSTYTFNYSPIISVRKKEKNLDGLDIEKTETEGQIIYSAKNIEALKPESFSPAFFDLAPKVMFASKQFNLEGAYAEVTDWDSFGKWMYNDLIQHTYDLSPSTISKVRDLVKDAPNDIEKAKIIYNYVQNKTRYISVQVGIGGWKPFNASEVDKLGYGDCKGLTNYTMALLKAVGVNSNYTVVYAGDSQRNFESDFAAMQGNHVILSIPYNNETYWLECTSQKTPFGFIGDFTDDRDVLVITPEGGKIQRTKKYTTNENSQHIKASINVTNDGSVATNVVVLSKGIQYDNKYVLESYTNRDLDAHYKKRWGYVNGLSIDAMQIDNNKKDIDFIETISFQAPNYSKPVGNRMLLTLNALNRITNIPDRYRNRINPLKINRGFIDVDEVEIKLPSEYTIESLPESLSIDNKFGSYKMEVAVKDESTLLYKREFMVNDGEFPKEDYEAFRAFYTEVSKMDNSKIALIKNQP